MIDAIVNRFKHHKHLIWIVSEEYQKALTAARVSKIAERIKMADDYDHPVGTHQLPGTSFDFNGDDNMDQFAMQLNDATTSYVHNSCVAAWTNVGGLKNVNLAEIYEFNTIPQTGAALRQKAWAAAMGGAYSMWLWMDIANTPVSDLEICGRLVGFMESTMFYMTQPYDSLARGSTDYVLADPGNVYIVYGDSGTDLGVNVQAGTYNVKWFDAIDGDWSNLGSQILSAGDQTFAKPGIIGSEAALYLEAVTGDIAPNDDCTTLYGENKDNDSGGEFGLFVKYADIYSWIEFDFGSIPVNQATLTLWQDDGDVPNPWTITVRGAEFDFDETTFTGTDTSGWTEVGSIPNVSAIEEVSLDITTFYNNNLGKTMTLRLYRADPQPAGNGPIFQDKELTRQFWWSANEGPKISINASTPSVVPIIADVSPDPDTNASAGTEYTKQLELQQGTLPVTWSVVQGPSGTQVDSSGFVDGWTPAACNVGSSFTIEIQALNAHGSDTETWQVEPKKFYLQDSAIDFIDLAMMCDEWLLTGSSLATDLDCSSDVDFYDYAMFAEVWANPPIPDLVISSLSSGSGRSYQAVYDGLDVGAVEFTDRTYTFSGVPSAYQGKTYIKTPNEDRGSTGDSFITFDINRDAIVYVAHDDRISNPSWLSTFTDTGDHLTSSDNSNTFSLYSKVFTAGTVTLGGNYGDGTVSMYSIVVVEQ